MTTQELSKLDRHLKGYQVLSDDEFNKLSDEFWKDIEEENKKNESKWDEFCEIVALMIEFIWVATIVIICLIVPFKLLEALGAFMNSYSGAN